MADLLLYVDEWLTQMHFGNKQLLKYYIWLSNFILDGKQAIPEMQLFDFKPFKSHHSTSPLKIHVVLESSSSSITDKNLVCLSPRKQVRLPPDAENINNEKVFL